VEALIRGLGIGRRSLVQGIGRGELLAKPATIVGFVCFMS